MPWSPPAVPISGTVITVAFATSLINNGLNWLRQLTGNADPPGADYVAVSTSTSTTSWQKVGTNLIAANAVTDAKLADPKVSRTMTNYASMALAAAAGTGYSLSFQSGSNVDGPIASDWFVHTIDDGSASRRYQFISSIYNTNDQYTRLIIAGTPTTWQKVWNGGNDGAGSGLKADIATGEITNTMLAALSVDTSKIQDGAVTEAKLASAVSLKLVPSGLIGAFRTAAAIAAGWSRFTDADGRLLVGAGTTFSVTFTENTPVGTAWSHEHAKGTYSIGTNVPAGGSVNSGGGASASPDGHAHDLSGSSATVTWTPVARVVVWAQKS